VADLGDFLYYLSGGASNSDPALSLGGVISTTEVGKQTLNWSGSPIAGITLDWGQNVPPEGLRFDPDNIVPDPDIVSVFHVDDTAAQGAVFPWVTGTYTLSQAGRQWVIQVTVDDGVTLLFTNETVIASGGVNNIFGSIAAAESLSGSTKYRCIYVKNTHGTDPMSISAYIPTLGAYPAGDSPTVFRIGLDPAGPGGTAVTIADEDTAPIGVTFSSAINLPEALPFSLAAGQSQAIWIERVLNPFNMVDADYVREPIAFRITAP